MTDNPQPPAEETDGMLPAVPGSVSLEDFRKWLREKSKGVNLAESFYLDSPSHLDVGDTGDSYCWECVQKQRWINRNKKEPWTDIRSEDWRESDSHVFCERCYKPLEHSPTEYHIESEIEHYESNTDDPLSATDALLMLNMIEMGAWEDEKHWPGLQPIAARILSQNVRHLATGESADDRSQEPF